MTPRSEAAVAAAAAVACLAALAAALWLPWMSSGGGHLHRDDLTGSDLGYERMLAWWPLAGLPVAAVALAAASVLAARPRPGSDRLSAAAWALALAAGFPVALSGTRWVGFQVARALDPGPSLATLQAAPYAVLAAGAFALAAGAWSLLDRVGWQASFAVPAACAATLLAMPLLPYGTAQGGPVAFHYDELTLAIAAETPGNALSDAAQSLAWARALLWATLLAGVAAAWATLGAPSSRWALASRWLVVAALLGTAVLAARFEWQWLRLDGVRAGLNHVLPAGVLVAAAFHARGPDGSGTPSPRSLK